MPTRVTIRQTEGGDPFAIHNANLAAIAGYANDPNSGYTVRTGTLTYTGGSPQHYATYGAIVSVFTVPLWAPTHISYLSSPSTPWLITEVRSGNFAYGNPDQPNASPTVDISGLALSLTQAMNGLETQVRYHPIDYFGSFDNDSFMGTDYDDMLNGNGGNDYLAGGLSNDTIYGGPGNDELRGASGADSIYGGQGNDAIFGGQGWDILLGGTGDDNITGGLGQDNIDGGDGIDIVTYSAATAGVAVDLNDGSTNTGEAQGDIIVNVENIMGTGYGDDLRGTAGANNLSGNFGNDTIYGRGGDDFIDGGPGADYLYGGAGADTFHFWLFSQTDYVQDFSFAGGDVLNINLGAAADTFAEVMTYAHQYGNDTVFAFSNDLVLVVANSTVSQFTPGDFFFG